MTRSYAIHFLHILILHSITQLSKMTELIMSSPSLNSSVDPHWLQLKYNILAHSARPFSSFYICISPVISSASCFLSLVKDITYFSQWPICHDRNVSCNFAKDSVKFPSLSWLKSVSPPFFPTSFQQLMMYDQFKQYFCSQTPDILLWFSAFTYAPYAELSSPFLILYLKSSWLFFLKS